MPGSVRLVVTLFMHVFAMFCFTLYMSCTCSVNFHQGFLDDNEIPDSRLWEFLELDVSVASLDAHIANPSSTLIKDVLNALASLLCPAGLWDKVTPACAVKYLRKKNPKTPQEASQLLVRLARRRGSGDNIGVVVVFLGMDMIKAANDHVDDDVVACSSNTDTFASHFSEAELSTHSTLDDCHQCSSIASIPPLGSIEDLTRLELESHAGGDSDQDNESPPSSGCVLDPELG